VRVGNFYAALLRRQRPNRGISSCAYNPLEQRGNAETGETATKPSPNGWEAAECAEQIPEATVLLSVPPPMRGSSAARGGW